MIMLSKQLIIFSLFTNMAHVIEVATRKTESHAEDKVKGVKGSSPRVF